MGKTNYLEPPIIEHVLAALTPANALVCRVCLETGLRLGDVLALRTEGLGASVRVVQEKTGKRRTVRLSAPLLRALAAIAGRRWVFEHRTDWKRHRTRQAVWADVKRAAKAFRVRVNLAPHSLRKVYAVQLLHQYGDIARVRRALSHNNDIVTAIYALSDVIGPRTKTGKKRAARLP